jgi:hypothetical protein
MGCLLALIGILAAAPAAAPAVTAPPPPELRQLVHRLQQR